MRMPPAGQGHRRFAQADQAGLGGLGQSTPTVSVMVWDDMSEPIDIMKCRQAAHVRRWRAIWWTGGRGVAGGWRLAAQWRQR